MVVHVNVDDVADDVERGHLSILYMVNNLSNRCILGEIKVLA